MKARNLIALLCLSAVAVPAAAQNANDRCEGVMSAGAVQLVVHNTNIRSASGEVAVTVYPDNPRRFLASGGRLLRVRMPAVAGTTPACFWLQPGVYAIATYHDANKNRDFDRTKVGMPAEGYGFSNDAPTRFSLPSFDTVRFSLPPAGRTLRIKMRYPGDKP
jgi:uncharacterized protein (DUF2141 family)